MDKICLNELSWAQRAWISYLSVDLQYVCGPEFTGLRR